jgi:hypothetical protein
VVDAAAALSRVAPSRSSIAGWPESPVPSRVSPPSQMTVPCPVIVLAPQFVAPPIVKVADVLNVPPPIVRLPDIEEDALIASEPFESAKFASLAEIVRLPIASPTELECVTVMPDVAMTTSSDGPGTAPVLQLDAVSQSPLAGSIQVTVARSVRSSRRLTAGRNPRRGMRRGERARSAGTEVRGERWDVRCMADSPGLTTYMRDQVRNAWTTARRASA